MGINFQRTERLYILPTGHGYAVLGLNVIFILVAAASGNNAVYILGFAMFGVYLLGMLATHFNVRALDLELVDVNDGFAGEAAGVTIAFSNPSRKPRHLIGARFRQGNRFRPGFLRAWLPKAAAAPLQAVEALKQELAPNARTLVRIELVKDDRGVYQLPRLEVSSVYPLGLFRCWTVLQFTSTFFIYPRRQGALVMATQEAGKGSGDFRGGQQDTQHEDFREHKRYETGESQHHVDWKAFARSGTMLTKRYETSAPRHFILDWNKISHLGTEQALSQLSLWIEELRGTDMSFEMRLPGVAVQAGRGWNHGQSCLRELAKFKVSEAA
jgi:uncharacterized protein (DUF58 family)